MIKDEVRISIQGGDNEFWNHLTPKVDVTKLIPSNLSMAKIDIRPVQDMTSTVDAAQRIIQRGGSVIDMPFSYYRLSSLGRPRRLDNADLLVGKEPVYGDMDNLKSVDASTRQLVSDMLRRYQDQVSTSFIARCCMEDLPKISWQQWRYPGWTTQSPIADQDIPQLSSRQTAIIRRVIRHYKRVLKAKYPELLKMSSKQLRMLDDDPPDTLTGMPLCASGPDSIAARIAILNLIQDPEQVDVPYSNHLDSVGAALSLPEGYMYSPMLATRQGPLNRTKYVPLNVLDEGGFFAAFEAAGAYSRARFVYPAPFHMNYILSPLYVLLSHARKAITGLWHDPESRLKYIQSLKASKYPYSVDFSGMDTSIFPHIIHALIDGLLSEGIAPAISEVFQEVYAKAGILYPHYAGDTKLASFVQGAIRPWQSGWKLTSEIDTLVGLCVFFDSMMEQDPTILDKWEKGDYVVAMLGDDTLFTSDKPINVKLFADAALSNWGSKLEVIQDVMFLKWMLPLTPEVPKLTRPLSRLIQQTLFNEDRYSGGEGGDKPPAILRLGLSSRMVGIKDHPHFSLWWPQIYSIFEKLIYVKDATPSWRGALLRGDIPPVDEKDAMSILQYSARVPSYFSQLLSRSKWEPSAATAVRLISDHASIASVVAPPNDAIRSAYAAALDKHPTAADYDVIASRAYSVTYG